MGEWVGRTYTLVNRPQTTGVKAMRLLQGPSHMRPRGAGGTVQVSFERRGQDGPGKTPSTQKPFHTGLLPHKSINKPMC